MDTNDSKKTPCFLALRACTLRLAFVLVIGLGLIVSALVVCIDVYGEKVLQYNQGDIIINQLSNSYCNGVDITVADNQSHFYAYVMPGEPKVSPKKLAYKNGRQFFMPSWTYQYWGVYLLKDSIVDIYICADQYIMFYVIKGLKSFREWQQTTLYRGYKQKHRLFPKRDCKSKSRYDHFRIKTEESEMYYLLFSSSVGWRFYTNVFMLLEFERSIYNISNAIHTCSSERLNGTCHLPLKYDSDNTVVVEHAPRPGNTPDIFQQSRITWQPKPRLGYYLKFFGGIYLCICTLTLIYSISRCMVKSQQRQERYPILSERKSRDKVQIGKSSMPRRTTRTTLASYEVVNQSDIEDEEACEQGLSQLNEELNASATYSSNDQVRDLNMTAAGISAI